MISDSLVPVNGNDKIRMKMLLKRADAIEAISVGDSYSRALDYRVINLLLEDFKEVNDIDPLALMSLSATG